MLQEINLAMRQPPDPRKDEGDGEEGKGMGPTPPLDQTLNDGEQVGRRGRGVILGGGWRSRGPYASC
jgi:hypothetical protein